MRKLLGILFLLNLNSCVSVPPDVEVCVRSATKGFCQTTISEERRISTIEELNEVGRVSLTPEAFGEIKKYILEMCRRNDNCKKNDEDRIDSFLDGGE